MILLYVQLCKCENSILGRPRGPVSTSSSPTTTCAMPFALCHLPCVRLPCAWQPVRARPRSARPQVAQAGIRVRVPSSSSRSINVARRAAGDNEWSSVSGDPLESGEQLEKGAASAGGRAIMVALDEGEASHRAVTFAVETLARPGDTIHLTNVIPLVREAQDRTLHRQCMIRFPPAGQDVQPAQLQPGLHPGGIYADAGPAAARAGGRELQGASGQGCGDGSRRRSGVRVPRGG